MDKQTVKWIAWMGNKGFGVTGPAAAAALCAERAVLNSPVVYDVPVIVISASDKTIPALVFGDTKEDAEKNARLIERAPEMSAEIEQMKEQRDELLSFVQEWLERQGTDENYMTSKARAAISKAKSK